VSKPVLELIRSEVRSLQEYHVAAPPSRIKLNQNESSVELPNEVREEILDRLRAMPWSRYPQTQAKLTTALRDALELPDGTELLVGNGSNELIQALLVAVLEPGVNIVIPEPTFLLYQQFAAILGASVIKVPLDPDLTCNGDRILEAVEAENARVVVLARPNNPTGICMPIAAIDRLLGRTNALVVIDEAYAEFADDTVLGLLSEHDNLIVLRTFSKAMRSAGLRIGYLMASACLTNQVAKVVPPFNTGVVSLEIAQVIIERREVLQPGIDATLAQRTWLMSALEPLPGITPIPSQANFICFHTEMQPRRVFERLLDAGILVRDVSGYPLLGDCLRVSVGTAEENREFVTELNRILGEQ